jgi:predicted nucleotidyltransferase
MMARTALDLTVEEWQAYRPGEASVVPGARQKTQLEKRRQRAWRVARKAAQMLRKRFGASRVVLFGSLAHDAWFTPWSDIDLAAWGIPADRFYSAVAAVTGLSAGFKIDLVDPDTCRSGLLQVMERDGIEL